MPSRRHALLLAASAALVLASRHDAGSQPRPAAPRVAAASDLKFALDAIIAAFRQETGLEIVPVYGSSGNFRRQIAQGAPFEMFMSADEDFVFQLADEGLTRDRGSLYGIGRIVLLAPHASPLAVDEGLQGLKAALADGRIRRFAIANPEHAPYGRAAEEALRHAGLWEAIRPRLVLGENVSQAAQFALSGSAEGGIVALSLVRAPQLAEAGRHALIAEGWHRPLAQRMVLLKQAGATAAQFHAYLQGRSARAALERYGFALPP
jgi:molybdate transport system substrate-binding protein